MEITVVREYFVLGEQFPFLFYKNIESDLIPVSGMFFEDSGLEDENGRTYEVEILKVTIKPENNIYHVSLKNSDKEIDKEQLKKVFKSMKLHGWKCDTLTL